MRRIAKLLRVDKKTIKRKLDYLAIKCEKKNNEFLKSVRVEAFQIDDIITTEHTKLKPLSISVAVDMNKRYLLGCEVSQIGAFGKLAEKSRRKYGKRRNEHKKGLRRLFKKLEDCVDKDALICSDDHGFYPEFVGRYFPDASYKRYKSERSCVVGQGELKKLRRDPLFAINHACAMLRASRAARG